jgi:hypothetical protein
MACVYFVQERGGGSKLIKIGVAGECPYTRLNQLRLQKRKSNPYSRYELLGSIDISSITNQTYTRTKLDLQKPFESLRDEGEWFRPGLQLVKFIQEHARPHFCSHSCPDGTSIDEEWRALQKEASGAAQQALNDW